MKVKNCWHLLYTYAISFFEIRKFKKIRKVNENSESSYLLSVLGNFNELLRKDVTYDNIKSHKKQGVTRRGGGRGQIHKALILIITF